MMAAAGGAMGGSSPSVERFACGSSLFASGAVTVSLYLLASSVRTRGHRESLRVPAGLLSRRTPIAAALAPARGRRSRAGSAGWSRECLRSTLGQLAAASWLRSRWHMHSHLVGALRNG